MSRKDYRNIKENLVKMNKIKVKELTGVRNVQWFSQWPCCWPRSYCVEFVCMLIYIHQCVALIGEMYSKGPK